MKTVRMNRPATTDGTPDMACTKKRTYGTALPRTSVMYTAVATPSGTAMTAEMSTISTVPMTA